MSCVLQSAGHHRYARHSAARAVFNYWLVMEWEEIGSTVLSHWVAAEHLPLPMASQ